MFMRLTLGSRRLNVSFYPFGKSFCTPGDLSSASPIEPRSFFFQMPMQLLTISQIALYEQPCAALRRTDKQMITMGTAPNHMIQIASILIQLTILSKCNDTTF